MKVHKCKILILFMLLLKICNVNSQTPTIQAQAQTQAQHKQSQRSDAAVSSYFRQDPYGRNTYAFGYEVDDENTNNVQFRDERRYLNGTIVGSYGYVRPDGRITLTRYLADKDHGYHTHTDVFQPGEAKKVAAARWPTFTNDKMKSANMSENEPFGDHQSHQQHNLTKEVIEVVKEKHGIDLADKDLTKSTQPHHDPTIADIVNGDIPLSVLGETNKSNVVGFETVNKFIPNDFPIVPFELPSHLEQTSAHVQQVPTHMEHTATHLEQTTSHSEVSTSHIEHNEADKIDAHSKYDQAKQNNAEKTLPKDLLKTHDVGTTSQHKIADQHIHPVQDLIKPFDLDESSEHDSVVLNPPKPLVDEEREKNANATWYRQVINEARKEFLQNLPTVQ